MVLVFAALLLGIYFNAIGIIRSGGAMTKTNDIHPVLPIICFVMLGMTIGATVAMDKFPFFPALDTTKLEAEDLLPRRSGFLRPGLEVK